MVIKMVPLKELCEAIVDCPHSTPVWADSGIPVIRNYNLVNGVIDKSNLSYVSEETYHVRVKRAIPVEDDIIFSREAPIGNCALVPADFKCCLGQRLVLLKVNKKVCNPKYLVQVLQSKVVKTQFARMEKSGSTVSNFNISDLIDLKIPVIESLQDQETVGQSLFIIDQLFVVNREKVANLHNLANHLFHKFLIDNCTRNNQSGKEIYNSEWATKPLGELLDEQSGSGILVSSSAEFGKYPFFTSGDNLKRYDQSIVDGPNIYLNTGGYSDVKFYCGPAAFSSHTWCINAREYTYYVYLYLYNLIDKIGKYYFIGSGLAMLQKDWLKDHKIPVPSHKDIMRFNTIVENIFEQISDVIDYDYALSNYKKSLFSFVLGI